VFPAGTHLGFFLFFLLLHQPLTNLERQILVSFTKIICQRSYAGIPGIAGTWGCRRRRNRRASHQHAFGTHCDRPFLLHERNPSPSSPKWRDAYRSYQRRVPCPHPPRTQRHLYQRHHFRHPTHPSREE